jgi:Helix-turn-helix domain
VADNPSALEEAPVSQSVEPSPESEVKLQFAAFLRDLKQRAGDPTEEAIALRMKCGRTTVSDLLRGRRFPRWELFSAFAVACGADPQASLPHWRQAWEALDKCRLGLATSPGQGPEPLSASAVPGVPGLAESGQSALTAFWYKNNPEFYRAAADRVRKAKSEVRVTYIRRYPPDQYTTTAASEYFQTVLAWAAEKVDDEQRTVRRIIGVPQLDGVSDPDVLRWLRDHHEETRRILTYEIRILPWDADADGLNMALIDDSVAFLAFSGGPRQRLNGFSVEDPRFLGYFAGYFEQLWSGTKQIDAYLQRASA